MKALRVLATSLVPSLCAACGRPCDVEDIICTSCGRRLGGALPLLTGGPPGIDRAWSSAPHEGVARDLVTALKFRGLLPVAGLMAERIQKLAPPDLISGAIAPVPAAPLRAMRRGFDPASELAAALTDRLGLPLEPCLRRRGWGRQVGRRRVQRIAGPPRVRAEGDIPRSVLLIDDVLTTGATLSACAQALRGAGAVRVVAITFARRL